MGLRFLFELWKYSGIGQWWWLHSSEDRLKPTKLYTLKKGNFLVSELHLKGKSEWHNLPSPIPLQPLRVTESFLSGWGHMGVPLTIPLGEDKGCPQISRGSVPWGPSHHLNQQRCLPNNSLPLLAYPSPHPTHLPALPPWCPHHHLTWAPGGEGVARQPGSHLLCC